MLVDSTSGLAQGLVNLWQRLTQPHPELPEAEHLQARLLSALLLFSLSLTLISLPADLPMFRSSTAASRSWVLTIGIDLLEAFVLVVAYRLSRTRRYPTAARLTVLIVMAAVLNSAIDAPQNPLLRVSLVIGILMSSLLLSLRVTLLVFACTVAELLLLPLVAPGLTFSSIVQPLYLVFVMGTLIVATAWVKQQHLAQIQRQSQALARQLGERTRLAETLREQSIRDPLTELFNRRYLEEALERELRRAERHGHPLGLIMLDMDRLKQVNDTAGHAVGDEQLREVGRLIRTQVRESDIPCRYGGDEFILILPETSLEMALGAARRLQSKATELRVPPEPPTLAGITFSLGVAIFPDHGTSSEDLMRAADVAVYRAKRAGGNRVIVAESEAAEG